MNQRNLNAFTLIELIVVISIISLLMAILLPALQGAREASMSAMNLSNLRQIQMGLHSYGGDNRSSLPWARFDLDGTKEPYWSGKLVGGGYISTASIFWGPFRQTDYLPEFSTMNHEGHNMFGATGYGVNMWGCMPNEKDGLTKYSYMVHPVRTDGHLAKAGALPSNLMTMTEAAASDLSPQGNYYIAKSNTSTIAPAFTINFRAPIAFLDGHVILDSSLEFDWVATGVQTGSWFGGIVDTAEPWFDRRVF